MILLLLWRENMVDSFLFVLHHRQILSTGLLNSLKKLEVCLINVRSRCNTGGNSKKSKKKWDRLGSQLALLRKSIMVTYFDTKCSWVSHHREMKWREVMVLRGSMERVSQMSHSPPMKHTSIWMTVLRSKVIDFGSQRIQDLSLRNQGTQRQLQNCVHFLMGYGILMNSTWFQQDGADLAPSVPYFALFMTFSTKESCRIGILPYFSKNCMATNLTGPNPLRLFS